MHLVLTPVTPAFFPRLYLWPHRVACYQLMEEEKTGSSLWMVLYGVWAPLERGQL